MPRVPLFRRLTWPYIFSSFLILFFFYQGLHTSLPPKDYRPQDLQVHDSYDSAPGQSTSSSAEPPVLRPGEFVDPASHWDIRKTLAEPDRFYDEPDGPGTLHDQPEERFYHGGTLRLTTSTHRHNGQSHPMPVIYDPYPNYNSPEWRRKWQGSFQTCRGPRGDDLDRTSPEDMISVYRGTQPGFPHPMFGSHEAMGLDQSICSDRYSRYGLYGLEEDNKRKDIPGFTRPREIDWDGVDWGELQSECFDRNANRFNPRQVDQKYGRHVLSIEQEIFEQQPQIMGDEKKATSSSSPPFKPRSAVVLRASSNMEWTQSHRQYLRSLIMELSLHSGSEYKVFFMLDDHDPNYPIEDNPEEAERLIETVVPPEFRNITVVFNDPVLARWYPKIDDHRAIYQHLQPLQVFSKLYPEFDYYWQFEFDARVIGHTYQFLEQAVDFAKRQPRKYLWERNAYFYTPGAHGTWDDFSRMVADSMAGKESVWGPVPARGITVSPDAPRPPVLRPEDDNFEWGVGEEADLITFLPIFNPERTSWTFPWMMWNLPHDNPRRSSVITQWRVSRRLLNEMHQASRRHGMALASEMSAPSWALLHGFKAVHVPQPLYVDGKWTPKEMARIFNRGPPENINGEPDSIWNWNHLFDYLWYRLSYMFATQTAEDLFRRWLGFGPEPSLYRSGIRPEYRPGRYWDDSGPLNEETYGRLCFPFMFLHTTKNTNPQKGPSLAVSDSSLQDNAV